MAACMGSALNCSAPYADAALNGHQPYNDDSIGRGIWYCPRKFEGKLSFDEWRMDPRLLPQGKKEYYRSSGFHIYKMNMNNSKKNKGGGGQQ